MNTQSTRKLFLALAAIAGLTTLSAGMAADSADLVNEGKKVFRFDTFGDEQLWTDKLGPHKVVETKIDPSTALKVGLKADIDANNVKSLSLTKEQQADLVEYLKTL